ncbi:hypothetical protein [Microbacterium panaciterrae]|uniref:Lipoprotein n=1 Tax=Microbacterium panaciterrae TaxID=985759 RepID=A0ABP8PQE0_9MICO
MIPRHSPLDVSSGRTGRGRRSAGPIRAAIATALIAATIGLAGCTPGPAPKPTPTPLFTSEADAFKAAERVYRDYVDAANAQQNGNASSRPQQYLAGAALDDDLKSIRDFEKSGLQIKGTSTIKYFQAQTYDARSDGVESLACLDVSQSRVVNSAGADVTPTNRPALVGLSVRMSPDKSGLKIVSLAPSDQSCQ